MPLARLLPWLVLVPGAGRAIAQATPPPAQSPPPAAVPATLPDRVLQDAGGAPAQALAAVLAWKDPRHPTSPAAVRAALAPGEALVELVQWQADARLRTTAFVLRPDGEPVRCELGPSDELQRAALTWLRLLAREQRPLDDASRRVLDDAARRAATLLLQPLTAALAGCRRVHFAADAPLRPLPFDALPTGRGDTLLIETIDVRQFGCGSELVQPTRARPADEDVRLLVVDGGSLDRPEAGREARAIAAIWQGAGRRPPLLHAGAELAARSGAPLRCAFVHLAGLRELRHEAPATAAVPREASWPPRLLAAIDLSACQLVVTTATRDAEHGGAPDLAAAWAWCDAVRTDGASSCVLPCWAVDAALARELVTAFWRELGRDGQPAEALRRTKLARLEANRAACGRALPGTWAGFQLIGSGR